MNALVNFVYDEQKGPVRFGILGTIFIAQGVFALGLVAAFKN